MGGFTSGGGGGGENFRPTPGLFGFEVPGGDEEAFFKQKGMDFSKSKELATKAQEIAERDLFAPIAREDKPVFVKRENLSPDEFSQTFRSSVLNPQFGATTSSEQALLRALGEQTQGSAALRGLGPATQGALAQNLAPTLIGLRQQQLGNLQAGSELNRLSNEQRLKQRQQDIGQRQFESKIGLGQRQQDIAQRASRVGEQQQQLSNFLSLAQAAAPVLSKTRNPTGASKGGKISGEGVAATAGALGSLLSDIKLKNILSDFTKGLKEILGLQTKNWVWKDGNGLDINKNNSGFIAQNIKDFIPEAVQEGDDGYLRIEIIPIMATMVNAIKELEAEIKKLKKEK